MAESTGHGQLRGLFAGAENAKFGLATEDFTPADNAYLAAMVGDLVIFQNLFWFKRER